MDPPRDTFWRKSVSFLTRSADKLHPVDDQKYLLGLRGLLVIQSFLWTFLQTFVPAAVKDSANTNGPAYQVALRKSLSVLFWNESLIYSSFILLSARTICIPFLKSSTKTSVASACFRRTIRLWIPTAIALAIVKIIFDKIGLTYIDRFKTITENVSFETPYHMPSFIVYFNSVFDLFWTTFNFSTQSGSTAFPSQTLWVVNVIYAQSYTVYMTMVIIPYTRAAWRIEAFIIFIITAWWVQSWAWYTITGILFADAVMNMDFKVRAHHGMPLWKTKLRLPLWMIWPVLLASGLIMQYLWVAWRPSAANLELTGHTGLYYTAGLNTDYNLIQPQARDDNYLVILGFFLLMETTSWIQNLLANPFFCYLGSRSLSSFLLTPTIIYTLGIKLYLHLIHHNPKSSNPTATGLVFFTCLVVSIPVVELFYRLVDRPSRVFSHWVWEWVSR